MTDMIPTYVLLAAGIAAICLFCVVMGYALAAIRFSRLREDSDLLCFIEQTEYTLTHVGGKWGVTDSNSIVGTPSEDLRSAIRSAAGQEAYRG